MARPLRRDVFDSETIGVYHCFNRIVRRSFLCGFDPVTQKDFAYRRDWFYQRLRYLTRFFAIDMLAYAIMSNHYHLVLRNRPDQVARMDDRQVVTAWLMICPKSQKQPDGTALPPTEPEIEVELKTPGRVADLRTRLSDPSWLIRQLSQYMGIRCNAEDDETGHFWQSRFGMTRLLDEAAVLACLAYVDLNPLRAHAATSLEGYTQASIGERLRTLEDEAIEPSSWLAPIALASETDGQPAQAVDRMTREEIAAAVQAQAAQPRGCLSITFQQYVELLRWLSSGKPPSGPEPGRIEQPEPEAKSVLQQLSLDPEAFFDLVHHFRSRFATAAGCEASLREEARRRGRRHLHAPGRRGLPPRARQPACQPAAP